MQKLTHIGEVLDRQRLVQSKLDGRRQYPPACALGPMYIAAALEGMTRATIKMMIDTPTSTKIEVSKRRRMNSSLRIGFQY
jgi:hypothetical protein